MIWVEYETLREALREVCEIYGLDESIIDAIFFQISEKKKQYLENIKEINEMMKQGTIIPISIDFGKDTTEPLKSEFFGDVVQGDDLSPENIDIGKDKFHYFPSPDEPKYKEKKEKEKK